MTVMKGGRRLAILLATALPLLAENNPIPPVDALSTIDAATDVAGHLQLDHGDETDHSIDAASSMHADDVALKPLHKMQQQHSLSEDLPHRAGDHMRGQDDNVEAGQQDSDDRAAADAHADNNDSVDAAATASQVDQANPNDDHEDEDDMNNPKHAEAEGATDENEADKQHHNHKHNHKPSPSDDDARTEADDDTGTTQPDDDAAIVAEDNVKDPATLNVHVNQDDSEHNAATDAAASELPSQQQASDHPDTGDEAATRADGFNRFSVDYASKSAGALVLEKSKNFQGTSNLLHGDKDKYAITPCDVENKFIVVALSEDILVKMITISNYERFSSRIKEFQVVGSQRMENWRQLGNFTAKSANGEQSFDVENPTWARYLQFRFITHYGSEHYCTISQIKVHGSTILQGVYESWPEDGDAEDEQHDVELIGMATQQHTQDNASLDTVEGDDAASTHMNIVDASANTMGSTTTADSETDPSVDAQNTAENADQGHDDTNHSSSSIGDSTNINGIDSNRNAEKRGNSGAAGDDDRVLPIHTNEALISATVESEGTIHFTGSDMTAWNTNLQNQLPNLIFNTQHQPEPERTTMESILEAGSDEDLFASMYDLIPETMSTLSSESRQSPGRKNQSDAFTLQQIGNAAFESIYLTSRIATDVASVAKNLWSVDASKPIQVPKLQKIASSITHAEAVEEVVVEPIVAEKLDVAEDIAQNAETVSTASSSSPSSSSSSDGSDTSSPSSLQHRRTSPDSTKLEAVKEAKPETTVSADSKPAQPAEQPKIVKKDEKQNNMIKVEPGAVDDKMLGVLSESLPTAACLLELDYQKFKAAVLAGKKSSSSTGGSAGPGNPMEPTFKKLTDEIFSLQTNLQVQEQFQKISAGCYRQVLLEAMSELSSLKTEQEDRIRRLEERFERSFLDSIMASAKQHGPMVLSHGKMVVTTAYYVSSTIMEKGLRASRSIMSTLAADDTAATLQQHLSQQYLPALTSIVDVVDERMNMFELGNTAISMMQILQIVIVLVCLHMVISMRWFGNQGRKLKAKLQRVRVDPPATPIRKSSSMEASTTDDDDDETPNDAAKEIPPDVPLLIAESVASE